MQIEGAARTAEFRRGWPVLMGAVLGMGTGLSVFLPTSGLFIAPLQSEFGWSRGLLAGTWAAALMTSLTMPLMGSLADRYGPRPFILAGVLAFAACYWALARMPGEAWVYFLIVAAIGLIAGPATAALLFVRPLVEAFVRRRGFALAIGMSGGALISIVAMPALQLLIERFGWRAGYSALAGATLVLGATSLILLGQGRAPRSVVAPEPERAQTADKGISFREALADPRFWLLALAMIAANLPGGALASQLQPLLLEKGLSGATAAMMGSLYASAVLAGRLVFGVLLDRSWAPGVGCLALSCPILGLWLFLPATPSAPLLATATILVALAQGAEGDLLAYFTSRFFGLRAFGSIFGTLGMLLGLSVAAGGISAGLMFDRLGGYTVVLVAGSVLSAVAAVAILATGSIRKTSIY